MHPAHGRSARPKRTVAHAPASVLLPNNNTNNQWFFSMPGIKIPATPKNPFFQLVTFRDNP